MEKQPQLSPILIGGKKNMKLPNGLTAHIESLENPKMKHVASVCHSGIQQNLSQFIVVTVALLGNNVHLIYYAPTTNEREEGRQLRNALKHGHWNVLEEAFLTVYHNTAYQPRCEVASEIHRAIMYKTSPDIWALVH
jgi:hypothetical protein